MKITLFALSAVICGSAFATGPYYIDPARLQDTLDNNILIDAVSQKPTYETLLNSVQYGFGGGLSVGTADPDFGDQTDQRLFKACSDNGVSADVEIQIAKLAPSAKVGWFKESDNARTVTWVLGDLDNDPNTPGVMSANIPYLGVFGLAFFTGNVATYESDDDVQKPLAVVDATDCQLFLGWEDFGVNNPKEPDYNDLVMTMRNVEAVPEPFTMALAALGLAGAARMRRRK